MKDELLREHDIEGVWEAMGAKAQETSLQAVTRAENCALTYRTRVFWSSLVDVHCQTTYWVYSLTSRATTMCPAPNSATVCS